MGMGLWGVVGHMRMQRVSCCLWGGFRARAMAGQWRLFMWVALAPLGDLLQGRNTELMVCSSGRA